MNRSQLLTLLSRLSLLLLCGTLLGLNIGYASVATELEPLRRKNPHVRFVLSDSLLTGSPGDTIMVPVRLTIDEGTRMYSDKVYDLTFAPVPFSIAVGGDTHLTMAGPVISDAIPIVRNDKHFDAELEYWVGSVLLTVPVLITGEGGRTYDKAGITIEFMTCDDHACYPPETVRLPFTVVTVDDVP